MKRIKLNHLELKDLARFTDPFIHSYEKEIEILRYFEAGELRPPSLIEHDKQYLIFNGNHRVLVAINTKLTISCKILENLDDVFQAQTDEGDQYRDLSNVSPITFEGVIEDLIKRAEQYGHEDPDNYSLEFCLERLKNEGPDKKKL